MALGDHSSLNSRRGLLFLNGSHLQSARLIHIRVRGLHEARHKGKARQAQTGEAHQWDIDRIAKDL